MKSIDEIRRANLSAIRDDFGSSKALADHLGRSESQITQWIRGSSHSVTGKPRNMKTSTARWIEESCSKPAGWLDADHGAESTNEITALVNNYKTGDPTKRSVLSEIADLPDAAAADLAPILAGLKLKYQDNKP